MSEPSPPDASTGIQRPSRRDWLLRGTYEAALILIGLLGAFALDEWQDARSRTVRVDALIAAVRAELEANLRQHEEASAYNIEVAERVWDEATKGAEYVPQSAFPRGLFIGPELTSAAWATAQNDVVLSDVPIEKTLMLARVYELQRNYVDDFNALANNLYARLLERDDGVFKIDALGEPLRIGGVLRDYAGRGGRLVDQYRAALEQL